MEIENETPTEIVADETATEQVDVGGEDETESTGEGESLEASSDGHGEETPEAEGEESEETEGEETFTPSLKFKASNWNKESRALEQKEYEIDSRFQAIMKDPESEKLVRELHEKAYGLDAVKGRYQEAKESLQEVSEENRTIKASIDGVRNIYQSAMKSGNLHKLDAFFEKLSIPQETILRYAMAKVELHEMTPEQRNAVESKLEAERRAEELANQQQLRDAELSQQTQSMKNALVDAVLERPAVHALVEAFDELRGKPGAFKEAVYKEGQLAWATEGVDISPQEAVKRVIENYGLEQPTPGKKAAGAQQNGGTQTPGVTIGAEGKKIVRRTEKTIPNISGRAGSPLGGKMKSLEDITKYRRETYGT